MYASDRVCPSRSLRTNAAPPSQRSAEWIAQAPKTSSGGRYPLAQFSPWSISNADVANYLVSATAPPVGISSFPDTQITMANSSGAVLAQPGALNSSGNGFTVTWQQSS